MARSLEFYEGTLSFVRIEAGNGYTRARRATTMGLHAAREGQLPPWNDGVWLSAGTS